MKSPPSIGGAGQIRLYDALRVLTSPEGKELLAEVKKDTYALSMERELDPLSFYSADSEKPRARSVDAFRTRIMEHVYDEHYQVGTDRALPIAIIGALAPAADDNGVLNVEEIAKRLGPYAARLADQLGKKLETFRPHELPVNTKYETADSALIQQIARSMKRSYGRSRMPLLSEVTKLLGGPTKLEGWKMASLGHLFATRPALYDELEANGLAREDHLVSGKGYSRNIDVVASLKADGWRVDESLLDPQAHYDKAHAHDDLRAITTLRKLFEGVSPGGEERFLLLDDGGNLAVALHKHFPEYAHLCRIVEQTDHGIQRIEREIGLPNLKCPVINVARSWLKKIFESPIIGEAVMHSVETAMHEVHRELTFVRKEAALLGFGAVNQAVAKAMQRRGFEPHDIWVWDRDPAKRALALQLGYRVPDTQDEAQARLEVLGHGHLTITATGQQTLSPNELNHLPPGAIMANAGSGNHELGMGELDPAQHWVAPVKGDRFLARITPTTEIGAAQVDAFMKVAIESLRHRSALVPGGISKSAAILGYDEGGRRAIERLLEAGFDKRDIRVHDGDPQRREVAAKDGFGLISREEAITSATVLVSNMDDPPRSLEEVGARPPEGIQVVHGAPPMPLGEEETERQTETGLILPALKDALLDRGEQFFRGYVVQDAVDRSGEQYRHRVLRTGRGEEVLVLRSGYVVNMETGIPPEYVQLILSMLLAGCLQATTATGAKLHELEHQDLLLARFERLLEKMGRSLKEPSFAGLKPAD